MGMRRREGKCVMREVRWERMFPDELEATIQDCPVVYFSYGLCEPHGPQNAVGLDALKAHAVVVRAAHEHGGIVAPPDFWHVHEVGGFGIWAAAAVGEVKHSWLTAVPPWVHFKNICYHLRAAEVTGFHAAVLLTGHYGPNWQDLNRLVELIQPHFTMRVYSLPDFEANQPGFDEDGKSSGDHAGKVETSLLWALDPDCVDVSRIPEEENTNKKLVPPPWAITDERMDIPPLQSQAQHDKNFAMGRDARLADRRIGERMVADEVRYLGGKAEELLAAYTAECTAWPVRTFDDVERFWEEEVAPVFGEFHSMQQTWEGQKPVPKDSVWYENNAVPDRS